MRTKTAAALYEYWTRRRGGRPVPLRRDIEPADLARILPDLFILEHSAAADPRFRLAGTRLCAQFGRELKGGPFDALFPPDQRNRVARAVENVMARRMPAILLGEAVDGALETTEIETVLLPLATTGERADRIIGAFVPLPGQAQPLSAYRYVTLAAVSAIDTERADPALKERPAVAMPASVMRVRPAADFLGQRMSRVLHLRVFEGGRGRDDARGPDTPCD